MALVYGPIATVLVSALDTLNRLFLDLKKKPVLNNMELPCYVSLSDVGLHLVCIYKYCSWIVILPSCRAKKISCINS